MTTSPDTIQKTADALKEHHFEPILVATKEEALAKIRELIPADASVMNGASRTLEEIGYVDLLKSADHPWRNLHEGILAETDEAKKATLRQQATHADYYLGSAHALTENGELMFASNSGSQLPHLAFTSNNIVLVVSAKKIVPDIAAGFARIKETIIPLEDERMKSVYGYGTLWAKTLILNCENPALGRTVRVIIVDEDLGF